VTEQTEPARRVFFALWPDAAALDVLEAAATAGASCCGGRRMRRDSLHVTLLYIGAVSPAQLASLRDIGDELRAASFDLTLDQLGFWPRNGIFWAGCATVPSRQRRLFEELSRAVAGAGFAVEARPYFPHITLLRHARCQALPELEAPIGWRSESFTLVESCSQASGAQYRVLGSWPMHELSPENGS
jgi:2'-5' RNA ligase